MKSFLQAWRNGGCRFGCLKTKNTLSAHTRFHPQGEVNQNARCFLILRDESSSGRLAARGAWRGMEITLLSPSLTRAWTMSSETIAIKWTSTCVG